MKYTKQKWRLSGSPYNPSSCAFAYILEYRRVTEKTSVYVFDFLELKASYGKRNPKRRLIEQWKSREIQLSYGYHWWSWEDESIDT